MDTKLLFTWNVGKMDGVWPQIFLIDVHGFAFHKKTGQPSPLVSSKREEVATQMVRSISDGRI